MLSSDGKSVKYTDFQKRCLEAFKTKSNVFAIAPSSAGKTFITEQYISEYFQSIFGKFLNSPRKFKIGFILPYKSLAVQEFNHSLSLFDQRGIKTLLAVGGVEIEEEEIGDANIIIGTYEKFLVLLKRYEVLHKYLKILIIDEFHFLGTDRGKVIEEILLEWQRNERQAQLILLSSSIANPLEISDWLNVYPIIETKRPVPIDYSIEVFADPLKYLEKTENSGKQILIFTHSRSESELLATKVASKKEVIQDFEIEKMISENLESVTDSKTKKILQETYFPPNLKDMVKKGVAYHHAGLSDLVRLIVENMFLNGELNTLVSTSTLAAGVNLPADVSVFTIKHNRIKTENNLVFQTLGRAGRLGMKDSGEGVVLVSSERLRKQTEQKFFSNSTELKTAVPLFHPIKSFFGDYDFLVQFYLSRIYNSDKTFSSELTNLHENIEDSLWFYQNRSKVMRNLADFELFQALFSSSESTLETHEIIDFYRRFDRTRNVVERKMEIISIEGVNTAAIIANIKEQSKLYQIYLSASRRSCTCQSKHSNYICKHQRFLLEKYPKGQERWLNNYGILDFLYKEGFIVKSAENRVNLTYMGQLAAGHYIHPYDFIDYLEFCGVRKELTITQYLKQFITKDKRIKQEIKANELSSLLAIRLAHDIVNGVEIRRICEKYNVSDSFVSEWRETIFRFMKMFEALNLFIGKKEEAEKIENWLKDSKGFDELEIYRSAIKSRNEVRT